MAKKPHPIITHVEILHLAIRCLESEIAEKEAYMGGIPECKAFLDQFISERVTKINALKNLYLIETGTHYG